jgi:recombination protein RecA
MPFVGSPEITAGGKAIPFYSSLRLNMRRVGSVKSGEEVTGNTYRVRVEKAKTGGAKVYRVAQFEVDIERGVDIAKDILNHAIAKDLVTKAGSWYSVGEERRQGERAIKEYMIEQGLVEKWREEILNEIHNS